MSSKQIYMYAYALLSKQYYSISQLKDRLYAKKYPANDIEDVIGKLITNKILNEQIFCQNLTQSYIEKGKGPNYILHKLAQKKYKVDISLDEYDWQEIAKCVYEKKFNNLPIKDLKDKKKRVDFLLMRGFYYQDIISII